jgi:2-dehydro-3-deoxyglucarate aldolase
MKDTSIRSRIRKGDITVGTWVTIGHTSIIEILCDAGFDWLTIDLEHNTINQETLRHLIIAGQAKGVAIFVRVPKNDEVYIKQALDAGADGLIVPMIDNHEDALKAVKYAYYPPKGIRGVGLSRAQRYGEAFEEYLGWANKNLTIIAQIEHIDAIKQLEKIASVDEIDALMIGPYDLSSSLGKPGLFDDDIVMTALDDFMRITKDCKANIGQHIVPLEQWRFDEAMKKGYSFIAYGTDFQFLRGSKKELTSLRSIAKNKRNGVD